MTNLARLTATKSRERLSSVLVAPLPTRVDDALIRISDGWAVRELAPAAGGGHELPGTKGLPVLGHSLDYIRFGSDFMRSRYERLGPVWWMSAFGTRVVVVAGPDATQEALTTKARSFSQDGWTYLVGAFFSRGLMLLSFDEHKLHRRIMQEAFTRDRVAAYVDQLAPAIAAVVPSWRTDEPTRIHPLLKSLTLDVATEVFMAGRGGSEDVEAINEAFVATVRAAGSLVRAPLPGTRWRAGVRGRAVLEGYFARHLPSARRGEGNDLFAGLCHARTPEGEAFTDDDVVNHMIFLMMAAHDTSTITTAAAAYFLAKHPEWQERARAESRRARRRVAGHRRPRVARDARPGRQGDAAAGRAGARADAAGGGRRRHRRASHPGRHAGRARTGGEPLRPRMLDRPRSLRPGAFRGSDVARTRPTASGGSRSAAESTSASGCTSACSR